MYLKGLIILFDVRKFGAYLARLRKSRDMTQSELSDILNVSRQAISKYENGDSFPDISILLLLSQTFDITLDSLINACDPSNNEAVMLTHVVLGKIEEIPNEIFTSKNITDDIINIAPFLKASTLDLIAKGLANHGINISKVVELAEYMNDKSVLKLLQNATFDNLDEKLLGKFIPFLDNDSKDVILHKILNGELNYSLISEMLPYIEYMTTQIDAAVLDGALDKRILKIISDYHNSGVEK
jgi:transcriptional regulator with XRE-family HTH domain